LGQPSSRPRARPRKKPPPATETPPPATRGHYRISDLCALLETYLGPREVADVYNAYLFGAEAHDGQRRRSGEPYIFHPVAVARILAELHLDAKSIAAALLHDVIEDTGVPKSEIVARFGEDVAALVDGVSKIGQIEFQTQEEEQAENFRKMLLAMTQDIRVILIKLADRLHNMRTLGALGSGHRQRIARETLEIYAPIANRLGVYAWARELEDLGFAQLYPLRYRTLAEAMRKRHGNRKTFVEKVRGAIVERLAAEGFPADVRGREKNVYSVYRKMRQKGVRLEKIYDVYAFRVIVDSVDSCYRALGIIHNLYKPIPGRFKDYIAIPKANGYQSLHTVVFGPFGLSIEIQIRTEEMNRVAEAGVAAHWVYKSAGESAQQVQQRALQWLKDLLETQQQAGNPNEFLEHLKVDLFPDEVYVFTPKGDIRKLSRGASVIDFAYDVHTDVGHQCVGARVNGELVPLRTVLRNGDSVEILTAKGGRPNPAWLDYTVSGKARARIRHYLKNLQRDESVRLGKRLLGKALLAGGVQLSSLAEERKQQVLKAMRLAEWNDLLAEIGLGKRLAVVVARQLQPVGGEVVPATNGETPALAISGTEGVVVTYARCCRPIPGDRIMGYLSAGRGIVVHTDDCPNLGKFRKHPEQWLDVQWEKGVSGVFPVAIRVEVRNQRGALARVAAAIAEHEANIDAVTVEELDAQTSAIDLTVEVRDRVHLAQILRRIRGQDIVRHIARKKG